MKTKSGFTLIELLAVIVILAIIAFFAAPIVLDIIEDAKVSAVKSDAYAMIEASKFFYLEQNRDGNNFNGKTFSFPDDGDLDFSGERPDKGYIYLNEAGNTSLVLQYDQYCAFKDLATQTVSVVDSLDCKFDLIGQSPIITEVKQNPTGLTGGNVELEVISDQTNFVQYSFDGGVTYQNSNKITESENETVHIVIKNILGKISESYQYVINNIDKEPPTFTVPSVATNIRRETNYNLNTLASNVMDNKSSPSNIIITTNPANVSSYNVGTYIIDVKATDEAGNFTIKKATINIIDYPYLVDAASVNSYVYYEGQSLKSYRVYQKTGSGATGVVNLISNGYVATGVSSGGNNMSGISTKMASIMAAQLNTTYASAANAPTASTMKILYPSYIGCDTSYSCDRSSTNRVNNVLVSGMSFWLNSLVDYNRSIYYMSYGVQYISASVSQSLNVMATITIKAGIRVKSGTGTASDPYILSAT